MRTKYKDYVFNLELMDLVRDLEAENKALRATIYKVKRESLRILQDRKKRKGSGYYEDLRIRGGYDSKSH